MRPEAARRQCNPPFEGHGFGTGKARNRRPGSERNRDDRIVEAGPKCCDEGERQDEAREGQENIRDAHHHRIELAAEITGSRADQKADGTDDDRDQRNDGECDACAPEKAAVDIASQLVRTKDVAITRRLQRIGEILRVGSCVASQGAKIAAITSSSRTARPKADVGLFRRKTTMFFSAFKGTGRRKEVSVRAVISGSSDRKSGRECRTGD